MFQTVSKNHQPSSTYEDFGEIFWENPPKKKRRVKSPVDTSIQCPPGIMMFEKNSGEENIIYSAE